MVTIKWLNKPENKDYDMPSRIAASGVAWGDEKDPEEIEAIQKWVKEEKEDIKRKKAKEEVEGGGKRQKVNKGKKKVVSKQPVWAALSSSHVDQPDDMANMYDSD